MKLGKKPPNISKKGAVLGMVICFAAMIAVASVYTSGRMQNLKEEIAKEEEITDQTKTTGTDNIQNPSTDQTDDKKDKMNTVNSETQSESHAQEENAKKTAGNEKSVSFSKQESMKWPINGGVILGYSMDRTVYFKTLDQYKCNPAMIIDGEEGDKVVAAADGIVSNLVEDSETGKTLTMNLGNEYQAVYGQLKDIQYSNGQYVPQGATIGKLAKPSKYYVEEGCNLFFKVTKDGAPIDPTQFLE